MYSSDNPFVLGALLALMSFCGLASLITIVAIVQEWSHDLGFDQPKTGIVFVVAALALVSSVGVSVTVMVDLARLGIGWGGGAKCYTG